MGYCYGIRKTKTNKKGRQDAIEILKSQRVKFDKLEIKTR